MNEKESIFKNLNMRNHEKAFVNAIKKGMNNPYDYMYMYSDAKYDYFKHCDTRNYVKYKYKLRRNGKC